jgi:hypothetical protein
MNSAVLFGDYLAKLVEPFEHLASGSGEQHYGS